MALKIKNERVCRLAKEAAERTGRTQVSVLEDALERYLAELADPEVARRHAVELRLKTTRALLAEIHGAMSDEDRQSIRAAMDAMYDENGLPA